nr:ribonuclease H-like domain-containing protein [Tanacetum cinerariifolium]
GMARSLSISASDQTGVAGSSFGSSSRSYSGMYLGESAVAQEQTLVEVVPALAPSGHARNLVASLLACLLQYTKAENRGVANVVAETAWVCNLLRELHSPLLTATLVYCDNVSAVYMSFNPVQHQRTKHIKNDIHFIRDMVTAGHVRVFIFHLIFSYALWVGPPSWSASFSVGRLVAEELVGVGRLYEVNCELAIFTEACQAAYEASKPKIQQTPIEMDRYGVHNRLMAVTSPNTHDMKKQDSVHGSE